MEPDYTWNFTPPEVHCLIFSLYLVTLFNLRKISIYIQRIPNTVTLEKTQTSWYKKRMDDDIAGIILQYNDIIKKLYALLLHACLTGTWRMQIWRQTRIESSSLKFVSEVVHLTFEHQKVSKIYIYQIIREECETWKFRSKFEKLQGDYRKQRINKHFPRGIWSPICIYKKRCDYTKKKLIYYLLEGTNKKFLYLPKIK